MTDENLTNGIRAAQAGENDLARASLAKAVKLDPASQDGWLWLGHVLNEPERRRYCYQRVLALNPIHAEAWRALDKLSNPPVESEIITPPIQSGTAPETPPPAPAPLRLSRRERRRRALKQQAELRNKTHIWPSLLFGFLLSLLLVALPLGILILRGNLDEYLITQNLVNLPPMPPLYVHWVDQFVTPTSVPIPSEPYNQRLDKAGPGMLKAFGLLMSGQCAEAMPLLDEAVLLVPEYPDVYYERAYCYSILLQNQRQIGENLSNIYAGLADIDRAIALRPDKGDYYALRGILYWNWAGLEELSVNRNALYNVALDNLKAASALGITLNYPLEATSISALEESGQCEEALARSQAFLSVSKPVTSHYTDVQVMQVRAYACLGRLSEALSSLRQVMNHGDVTGEQKMLEASILYQQGYPDEALQILDNLLIQMPEYNGERYYLRGLIMYEKGKRDEAYNSLMMGSGQTWFHGGLYSYVQGLMGLELIGADNRAKALDALQYAEASLNPTYNILRKRMQKELNDLSVSPLDPPVSVPIITPVPAFVPRPTARPSLTPTLYLTPTLTPTPQASPTLSATPTEGTLTPEASPTVTASATATATVPAIVYIPPDMIGIIVDLQVGSGPLILTLGERQVLRFQPAAALSIQDVQSLTIILETDADKNAPPPSLELWNPFTGIWTALQPKWGETLVKYPGNYVLPEGDIYIAMRSPGARLELTNFSLRLVILDSDGQLAVYGRP